MATAKKTAARSILPRSARNLADAELVALFARRVTGARMKTLENESGLSRETLRAHFKRIAHELAASGGLPGARPSVIEAAKGVQKQHLAEAVEDLAELLHFRKLDGEVTLNTLARIIGANDVATWHRFYELRKTLKRFGLHLGKRLEPGSPSRMDARLVFGFAKLKAFVNRELAPAEAALRSFKRARGINGRFRGNGK